MLFRWSATSVGCSLGISFAVVAACVAPLAGQVDEQAEALLGTWVLNDDLSDDLPTRAEMSKRSRRPRGGGFSGPGGGFGGPGGGGFGGRRGGFGSRAGDRGATEDRASRRTGLREAIKDLTTAPRRMTITGTSKELVLAYNDRRVVRLFPDGREHAGLAGTSMRVTRVTRWHDGTLRAKIELDSEVKFKIEQNYHVSDGDDGLRLVVTSQFTGGPFGQDMREIRRVYDGQISFN